MIEVNNLVRARVSKKFIRQTLNKALKLVEPRVPLKGATISVALADEATIKNLNKKYRKVNKVTDVLSFGSLGGRPQKGPMQEGAEIVVCWPVIKKQAKNFDHSIREELKVILVHGLLHLLGWQDDTKKERQKMERKTNKVIEHITHNT